jgi:transposase
MLTVDKYARIRQAYRDGMSIREMARRFNHSRKKVREVIRSDGQPTAYKISQPRPAPQLDAFKDRIRQILEDDKQSPPKQRHTAQRIFERIQAEGYAGSYDPVRRFVKTLKEHTRETFIPLSHDAGQRLESDFGEISVDFPEGRRKVPVLILVWSYSNYPFAIALPSQRIESILQGTVRALEFFGCVPREVWWDNPKTVATAILSGRERKIHPRWQALASHYVFEPLYCMPARGNEKPYVENRVKDLKRRWSTPVPQVDDLQQLNEHLQACCLAERERTSGRNTQTIGERFEQDRQAAGALPDHAFDPCLHHSGKVDKYQLVRFETVSYSVPRQAAFQPVSLKVYADRIEVAYQGTVIARHARSYQRHAQVLCPLHYLTTLGRRPAAVDHSTVYRDWKLPEEFEQLRQHLEARQGTAAGVRQYVRVLQLLADHPLSRVRKAMKQLPVPDCFEAQKIIQKTHQLAGSPTTVFGPPASEEPLPAGCRGAVPLPDLSRFDQFLSLAKEGDRDEPITACPAEDQPENPATAEDQCGV